LSSAFSGDNPIREAAMSALFLPGQPMDYQRVYGNNGLINRTFIGFGNYNFGVVAAAGGYSLNQALIGAGAANLLGTGSRSGPYLNNPQNVPFITQGFNDYRAGLIGGPLW
jgi:hypothetical protein